MVNNHKRNKELLMTLGILSKNTQVPKTTLREWIRRDLISISGYSPRTNYPLFGENTEKRVLLIRKLRNLGYGFNLIEDKLAKTHFKRPRKRTSK